MGILRAFEKMGDGLIGMIFKLLLFLIVIVVILLSVMGIATYWKFLIGFLIGALFAPYLYTFIEENLQLGLPEFFFWNYGDVIEAFFINEHSVEELNNQVQQKTASARSELVNLDKKYENLKVALEDLKAKRNIKELILGKESKKYDSSRLRKAVLMNIGDPEWVAEMKEIKTDVDWNKYM